MEAFNQKLTYIKDHHSERRNGHSVMYSIYKCECGNECIKRKADVKRNQIKSCGKCIGHGMTGTRFYRIWRAMKTRTCNKNYFEYNLYGGRGIKLCDNWMSFENFRDDMLNSYNDHIGKFGVKETQIDREDYNDGYYKDNCRWVTSIEQANNRRNIKRYNYKGMMMTVPEISKESGIPSSTLYDKIRNNKKVENQRNARKNAICKVK